jgi:hypothetical protein
MNCETELEYYRIEILETFEFQQIEFEKGMRGGGSKVRVVPDVLIFDTGNSTPYITYPVIFAAHDDIWFWHWSEETWKEFVSHTNVMVRTSSTPVVVDEPLQKAMYKIVDNKLVATPELLREAEVVNFND